MEMDDKTRAAEQDRLYQPIGRLQVEVDWLRSYQIFSPAQQGSARCHTGGHGGVAGLRLAGQYPRTGKYYRAWRDPGSSSRQDRTGRPVSLHHARSSLRTRRPGSRRPAAHPGRNGQFAAGPQHFAGRVGENRLLDAAATRSRGNLSSAARLLGMTRPQLAYP